MSPTTSFGDERKETRFERTLTVSGPVTMEVGINSGNIRIQRGEAGSVTIRGVLRARRWMFGWRGLGERIEQLAADLPFVQNGNTIWIGDVGDRWLLRGIHVLMDILVPAETAVRVIGDSADLRVEGLQGPVDCETDSGQIEISAIGSRVSAVSDSGAIEIRQVAGSIDVRTDSGEIEALEIGGAIDAESDSGSIQLSQTIVAPVNATADSGSIRIKLASSGGYTIRLRTDHGRIETPELSQVRSARREVEGQVRGGGSVVEIETDSGDIEVSLS
jgi:hypothetical protein